MILKVTSISAGLLTLIFTFLGLRVINMRRTGKGPSIGTNADETFLRAVRSHQNLGEYGPFSLILLGLYELQSGNETLLIVSSTVFILGRLVHAVGFGFLGTGPWRTLRLP